MPKRRVRQRKGVVYIIRADIYPCIVRKAVLGMMAMHRLQDGVHSASKTETARMKEELAEYKREAEDVSLDRYLW